MVKVTQYTCYLKSVTAWTTGRLCTIIAFQAQTSALRSHLSTPTQRCNRQQGTCTSRRPWQGSFGACFPRGTCSITHSPSSKGFKHAGGFRSRCLRLLIGHRI